MSVNTVTVLPEGGGATAPVRTVQPLISAAGVNDLSALARQQLMNAVPATVLIPGYAANVTPAPKLPARISATHPSSALAAQIIAQTPGISEEDMALFAPRPPAMNASEYVAQGDDIIATLRAARGEVPQSATKTAPPATSVPQPTAQPNIAPTAMDIRIRTDLPAVLTQFARPLGMTQTRGAAAYQLAETRNAAMRRKQAIVTN